MPACGDRVRFTTRGDPPAAGPVRARRGRYRGRQFALLFRKALPHPADLRRQGSTGRSTRPDRSRSRSAVRSREREIVLQGMDFDLRLLRRTFDLPVREVFDTVIAARMLGLREFSLAALVQQYFDVTLAKGSQKANWARRPLPPAMEAYAKNDTHYLLPARGKMEEQMRALGRMEWFRQSCQRAARANARLA